MIWVKHLIDAALVTVAIGMIIGIAAFIMAMLSELGLNG